MAERNSTLMPTTTAISTSSTNHVFLHEWWLVNAKGEGSDGGGGGLAVGGFAHRDSQRVNLFCSAPISKRLNTTTVLARDGVVVSLNGLINMRHATSNGYSTEVCNKFMLGFPYDWDDYAACHVHQSRGACDDVLDRGNHSSGTVGNISCQTTLEDVPVTAIRDMPKISDLKNLMDDILAKVGHPKDLDELRAKLAAERFLEMPPVVDQASECNKDNDTATPSKKVPNIRCQQEEVVCSPNRISTSTRRAKRCLKSSPGEDSAVYNQNLQNANVEVETLPSKRKTRSSQLEDAVNCQNQMTNSARSMNSVHKACRYVAGQDQDQLGDIDADGLTPKKSQSSRYQTSISPRSIKSLVRASVGQDVSKPKQTQLHDTNIEMTTSVNKGQSRCLHTDSAVKLSGRTGVSTRSMTRLKKPKSTITATFSRQR